MMITLMGKMRLWMKKIPVCIDTTILLVKEDSWHLD